MPSQVDTVLSKTLTEKGYLTPEALDPVVMKAAEGSGGLASFLVKRGMVSEDVILDILSEQFNLKRVDLAKASIDKAVIDKIPLKFAEYYKFMPIKLENKKLTVAVCAPLDIRKQDEIRTQLGYEIVMMLASENDVTEAVQKFYGLGAGTIGKILETSPTGKGAAGAGVIEESEKVEEIEKSADDASVIKLVNQILMDAFQKRATDIHIEPYRGKVKVRYRIDGVLYNTNVPLEIKQFIMPIVSRIKIMSNLNIIEKRLPQDGRSIVKISGETIDLRISSIPTPSGESIVIRLLPMNRLFSLEKLGLEKEESSVFNNLIEKPHGIVLITGPTGSGKSTTLYACLSMINTDERKIITIEDPVEYEMEGVTQIQVVPAIGLDFARGLRSILRHDPDVIMVGEIRDLETAEIAARVALTGHMVFSTLHTNNAASGITRLVDIGVEPYLVASSVEAFIAQRLVRTICPHCRIEDPRPLDPLKAQIARELGLKSAREVKISKGKGCDKCNSSGFWGRVAIFEILLIDEQIREMIMKRVPAGDVEKVAIAKGMCTLRQSGWRKVIQGITTPEEILEVAPDELSMTSQTTQDTGEAKQPMMQNPGKSNESSQPKGATGAERRTFARLQAKVNVRHRPVKFQTEGAKKNTEPERFGVSKDLSAGGMVFVAQEQYPISTTLELKIELPDLKTPIDCLGRVVRVTELEPSTTYDIAVCFLDLSGTDRAKLEKFVQEEIP